MNRIPRGVIVIFVIIVLVPMTFGLFFQRIEPMEIGVRQVRWGGGGIENQDFATGFHLGIWGYHRWFLLPRKTHWVHFAGSGSGRDTSTVIWEPELELRTKDQNIYTVDVSVPYHIKEGDAWRIVAGAVRLEYPARVQSTMLSVLREELAQLSSEDLQSTDMRLARAHELLPMLNAKLSQYFVEAETILIRRVGFGAEYEDRLQQKQFLTQKAQLDRALGLQAKEEQTTNTIEKQIVAAEREKTANWEKTIQEERSRFEVLIAEIEGEAEKYQKQVRAAAQADAMAAEASGQLAVDQAEALRNELRNVILNSRGGDIYLALEAAENINMPSVTLNSNDPRVPIVLDIAELTRVLTGAASTATTTPTNERP
jgi:regulator of protease activity HflC (stomatin/prohibitin superfamily)